MRRRGWLRGRNGTQLRCRASREARPRANGPKGGFLKATFSARASMVCVFSALLGVLPGPAMAHAGGGPRHDRVERQIIRKINQIRASAGLGRVRSNRALA